MGLSVRDTYRMSRARHRCTRKQLELTRARLTPYTAETHRVTGQTMTQRSAAVVELRRLVEEQVKVALTCEVLTLHNPEVWVIVCPDATPLWKTSATKCDVFVHIWGGEEGGVRAAGHTARWSMWWAIDGPDDGDCLRALDNTCELNAELLALEQEDIVIGGRRAKFLCFLTGDGKCMKCTNQGVGHGESCWSCDNPDSLEPSNVVLEDVRWGAFLRGIPVVRRVGDACAHGQCRVANMFIIRLKDSVAIWAPLCRDTSGRGKKRLRDVWVELGNRAACIPPSERLAPRRTPEGAVDISTAKLFWKSPDLQQEIVQILREDFGEMRADGVAAWALVKVVLESFSTMYTLWRKKYPLTDNEVKVCQECCAKMGRCWSRLGWRPSPWVHWVVAHSGFFLAKYRTLYLFSSIPSEKRNRKFKVGLKHSMRGWCLRHPRLSWRGLAHVVNMESLDVGLLHEQAKVLKSKCLYKTKRRCVR